MRPPLTRVELRIIHGRNRDQDDVVALLWEVARLRKRLLRVEQLHAVLGELPPHIAAIMRRLRAELEVEPCIREMERKAPDAFARPAPPTAS